MNRLKNKRLFLLDMDGTLYLDDDLFPHVPEFLQQIKDNGGRYLFLTNNSSKSVSVYVEKLARLGIPATAEDFFTSTMATCVYLQEHYTGHRIYAAGTAAFRQELAEAGFPVTDRLEEGIDCLLMGNDNELTFQKLEDACILLKDPELLYLATNPDWVCPTAFGYVPDCGSVCEMLWRATGRRPYFIGKPEPAMVNLAMAKFGYRPEETVMVGDRIYTDIASGVNAGVDTVLVFSGETTREVWRESDIKPTYALDSVTDIYNAIR
ncbi:MAG: HAD-IIA family hydrolase [Clostridia bacterium]|nr:HAD-IIA family hydrolase [Clostridia bacterium]